MELNDNKNYYYYESDNIKVDIKFEKEDGSIKKTESRYEIKSYPSDVASKINERMSWKKFGMAVNDKKNEHNNTADDVNFDISPDLKYYYYKTTEKPTQELNKKIYYDSISSSKPLSLFDTNNNINNNTTENDVDKKYIVSCRYCGSGEHWSIKCPQKHLRQSDNKTENTNDNNNDNNNRDRDRKDRYKQGDDINGVKIVGLKLTDIDPSLSDAEIKYYLSQFGSIIHYYNVKGKKQKSLNELVYVTFSKKEENDNAYEKIPRKNLGYTMPSVEYAKPRSY
jgi:hypothetical protein